MELTRRQFLQLPLLHVINNGQYVSVFDKTKAHRLFPAMVEKWSLFVGKETLYPVPRFFTPYMPYVDLHKRTSCFNGRGFKDRLSATLYVRAALDALSQPSWFLPALANQEKAHYHKDEENAHWFLLHALNALNDLSLHDGQFLKQELCVVCGRQWLLNLNPGPSLNIIFLPAFAQWFKHTFEHDYDQMLMTFCQDFVKIVEALVAQQLVSKHYIKKANVALAKALNTARNNPSLFYLLSQTYAQAEVVPVLYGTAFPYQLVKNKRAYEFATSFSISQLSDEERALIAKHFPFITPQTFWFDVVSNDFMTVHECYTPRPTLLLITPLSLRVFRLETNDTGTEISGYEVPLSLLPLPQVLKARSQSVFVSGKGERLEVVVLFHDNVKFGERLTLSFKKDGLLVSEQLVYNTTRPL